LNTIVTSHNIGEAPIMYQSTIKPVKCIVTDIQFAVLLNSFTN